MSDETRTRPIAHLDRHTILQIAGNVEDAKVAAIERTGATLEELEEAVSWASGQNVATGDAHRHLSGMVAQLYEILTADEDFDDERD